MKRIAVFFSAGCSMHKFKYRIRSLAILFVVFSVSVAPLVNWMSRRNAAVNTIMSAGGALTLRQGVLWGHLRPASARFEDASALTTREVLGLAEFAEIKSLYLDCKGKDLPDLGPLSTLKMLRSLTIENASNSVFKQLGKVAQLTDVSVSGENVNGDLIEELLKLDNLQRLNLSNTSVGNNAIDVVGGISDLQILELRGTRISDEGVRSIARLSQLQYLDLSETPISSQAIGIIASMSNLEQLKLEFCPHLVNSDDVDVTPLARLEKLSLLILIAVDQNGFAEIQEQRPSCLIIAPVRVEGPPGNRRIVRDESFELEFDPFGEEEVD